MKFLQNLLVHIPVGHNASTQHHRVRVNHTYQIHDKIGKRLSCILHQHRTERVTFLTKCKHLTHNHPFPFFSRNMQAGLILPSADCIPHRQRRQTQKTKSPIFFGSPLKILVHTNSVATATEEYILPMRTALPPAAYSL